MARRVTVTLEVDDDGDVRLVGSGAAESVAVETERSKKPKIVVDAPVDENNDWVNGFDPDFLGSGDLRVNLPQITGSATNSIAPLLDKQVYGLPVPDPNARPKGVLNYLNYSVVMHKVRKLAFYSAANVDGGSPPWTNLDRPRDRWLYDDRIDRAHQLGPSYYISNKVDRGHLTRREDLEWGPNPVAATRRANGTCTWTNCVPQHELFNQDRHPDRNIRLWHGLERYILEDRAREHQFNIQVFTGPIFDEIDPVYRKEKVPLDFWKIVVAVDASGSLFATGYILSQRDVMIVDKLDEAALDMPFGKFQLYQREISEIESVTQLKFTYGNRNKSLSLIDPLAKLKEKPAWQRRRRRRGVGAMESFEGVGEAHFDDPLEDFDDIILG